MKTFSLFLAFILLHGIVRAGTPQSPPVPPVTPTETNPVAATHLLAGRKDGSFQVLLWRVSRYLATRFKDAPANAIRHAFEEGGAGKLEDTREEPDSSVQMTRYLLQKNVLRSQVASACNLLVEVRNSPGSEQAFVELMMVVEVDRNFFTVARHRDFPQGTVLDRVFGLADLQKRARATSRLDRIVVSCGEIGYASTPGLGWGFSMIVELSDPTGHARLKDQSVSYMAASGLEPLGSFYTSALDYKATPHVPRDILLPGAALGDEREHGYPSTFGSFGSSDTPR